MRIIDLRPVRRLKRRRRRRGSAIARLVRRTGIPLIVALAAIVATQIFALPDRMTTSAIAPDSASLVQARFTLCGTGSPRADCVVDGDTFWVGRTRVRIADIDAPETTGAACAEERRKGEEATRRLQALLNAAPFEMRAGARDTDRYGRALRTLHRDGQSIGSILVAEGLAREWQGRRAPWCTG